MEKLKCVSQSVGWLSDVLKSSVFSWTNKHACVLTVFLLIMQLTAGWLQEQRKSQTYNIQIVRGTAANGGFLIAVKAVGNEEGILNLHSTF